MRNPGVFVCGVTQGWLLSVGGRLEVRELDFGGWRAKVKPWRREWHKPGRISGLGQ